MTDADDPNHGPPRWPGDTRPPYAPSNTAAEQHGAWSERKVAPIAATYRDALADAAPWTAAPAFARAVASWAYAEAQADLIRGHLDEVGLLDEEGEVRGAATSLDRIEGRLAKLRAELGLTPQSLGRLLATSASTARTTGDEAGLAALQKAGAEILASRAIEAPASPPSALAPAALDAGTEDAETEEGRAVSLIVAVVVLTVTRRPLIHLAALAVAAVAPRAEVAAGERPTIVAGRMVADARAALTDVEVER